MASFCVKCGSPLTPGPFCVKCGADTRQFAQSSLVQPAQAMQPQPVSAPAPTVPSPSAAGPTKSSPWVKIIVGVLAVGFVASALALGGAYYAYHRIKQKVHDATGGLIGSDSDSNGNSSSNSGSGSNSEATIDACRLLNKEAVSRAIGVEIIRAEALENNSCNYIAKGTQADMMAKHAMAMAATRGADEKTQQMLQQFAGGMFKVFQSENKDSKPDTGEVPVFNFSIDQNNAEAQMRLNAKVLGRIGGTQNLPGIGDQAFVSADGMIMLRKGNKLVRIMYMICPCGTEQVKPLAKEIADAL